MSFSLENDEERIRYGPSSGYTGFLLKWEKQLLGYEQLSCPLCENGSLAPRIDDRRNAGLWSDFWMRRGRS